MRITISINDEQYPQVIGHINKLKKSGSNISKFFSDAAKEYLADGESREKKRLKALIREIIREEGLVLKEDHEDGAGEKSKDQPIVDEKELMRSRLNSMFDDMESNYP